MTMTAQSTDNAAATPKKKRPVEPRNGVDTPNLFATINAVKEQRELAQFTFRASNRWLKGTHSRSRIRAVQRRGR